MDVKNDVSMVLGTVAQPASAGYGYAQIYISTETYYSPVEKPAEEVKFEFELDNGAGVLEKIERKDTATVTAQWISLGNQYRRGSPMLTGGETVLVFRIAGIKKYFYTTFFADLDLKAQEQIEFLFPSRPRVEASEEEESSQGGEGEKKQGVNPFRPDPEKPGNEITGSYKFIIDTTDDVQQIYLTTTNLNGERSILTANFNAKKGSITFFNDRGEVIALESSLPAGEGEEGGEDEPGRLRFATSGYTLFKSTKGKYEELLDGAYSKITTNEFKHITEVAMYKIGCEIKEVEGPAVYSYKDKYTAECKGDFGVKTLTGNIVLESGGDIGFTSLSGKMKIFSGTEITVISPKVNFVSPAVSVTGTLTGAAISMGAAPSADNTPLQIKSEQIKWDKFDEKMEEITKLNTIKAPEEEEKKEEEKKEEEKEEEEKKPEEVDGKGDSQDSVMNMDGKMELKAKQTVSIDGQAGTTIKGGGQDLIEIMKTFVNDVQSALTADLAASTVTGQGTGGNSGGPVVTAVVATISPNLSQTISACNKAISALTSFKGSASRSLHSPLDNEVQDLNQTAFSASNEIPEGNLELKLQQLKKNLNLKK